MPSTLRDELQLRIVSDDDTVIRDEVILQLDKSGDRLETVGLCLEDSKDLLGRLRPPFAWQVRWTPLVRQLGWRVKRESRGIIAPCRCRASVSARTVG
jgi:hypothetical protein